MAQTRVNRVGVANSGAANTGTTLATIANSDILIFDKQLGTAETGTPSPTAANNDLIYIVQGLGNGALIHLAPHGIEGKLVTKITSAAYQAPQAKVLAIGFDGTTGNIVSPTNDTTYQLRITFNDDQRPSAGSRQSARSYFQDTDSSATTQELVNGLVKQVNSDPYMKDKITANAYTNGTFTALTNNATVVKGSVTVTSTAHGRAVGDLVRIGGTGVGSAVYQVATVPSTSTFTLTYPYQGASATVLAANIGVMTAITATGIRITSIAIPYNGIDTYQVINFDAFLSNEFSNTAESKTVVTPFAYGSGFWQQIRDMEFFAQGYISGPVNRVQFPDANLNGSGGPFPTRAVVGGQYSLVTIEYVHRAVGDFLGYNDAPMTVNVAFDVSSASTKRDAFLTTLASITGVPVEVNY